MYREAGDTSEMYKIFKVSVGIFCFYLLVTCYPIGKQRLLVRINDPKFTTLGPYDPPPNKTDDIYNQLIDLRNFTFTINPQTCQGYDSGLLLLIIITSKPTNLNKRYIIRNTWGRSVDSTKVIFLIGESKNATISRIIKKESNLFGDIVQGNFIDAYRNMTYKHVMGLKWVAHHCPTAKYILKVDDDVVVVSYGLRQFLARELSPWGAHDLIACEVKKHSKVERASTSKWKVTEDEYIGEYYPTYCSGWTILYSQNVINRLLSVAQTIPYFWIDDVHITGVIADKLNIDRTPFNSLILTKKRAEMLTTLGPKYSGPFLFGPPDLTTDKISEIWKAIPK